MVDEPVQNPNVSPPGSFQGWRYSAWFKKNKNEIKEAISITAAIMAFFASSYLPIEIRIPASALVWKLAKLGVDAIDFKYSEVKLE